VVIKSLLDNLLAGLKSQGLQEINDRADLLVGQNPVPAERRHHGLRIALGLVEDDRDQLVAIGVFCLEVLQLRADRSRQVAALDDVAGQAIALAAVEGELPATGLASPARAVAKASRRSRAGVREKAVKASFRGVMAMVSIAEIAAFQSTKGIA